MSENQQETGPSGDTGTQPVSETAEQGTPATEQAQVEGSTPPADTGDGAAAAPAEDGGGSPADAPAEGAPGEDGEKPVWNTATHGPLGEDDPRRERYQVI